VGSQSRARLWRSLPADGGGKALTIGPRTTTSAGWKVIARVWRTMRAPKLEKPQLQTDRRRLVGYRLEHFDTAQEDGQM
jgi:hypothetical protein